MWQHQDVCLCAQKSIKQQLTLDTKPTKNTDIWNVTPAIRQ